MTNIRELFKENLRKFRHAAAISQSILAERINSSTNYIGILELGRKFPSPEMMERLASALGIDTADFFLKDPIPEEVIRSYRKAVLEDIQWRLGKVFEERFRELEGGKRI